MTTGKVIYRCQRCGQKHFRTSDDRAVFVCLKYRCGGSTKRIVPRGAHVALSGSRG